MCHRRQKRMKEMWKKEKKNEEKTFHSENDREIQFADYYKEYMKCLAGV